MKNVLKKVINTIVQPFGLAICSRRTYNFINTFVDLRYIDLIKEVQGFFKERIFPELVPFDDYKTRLIAKLMGTGVSEAMYLLEFLRRSLKLEGDICEFGAGTGATSALLANEIRTTEKTLWLFDSFKGLPKPSQEDTLIHDVFGLGSIEKYEGNFSASIDSVRMRLRDIEFPPSRVRVIPGFIEKTINAANGPDKICFAYVDVDLYKPTLIALEFLGMHLSSGGTIIVDDYGFFSSGVKKAVDEFMERQQGHYEITFPYKFAGYFCILTKKY